VTKRILTDTGYRNVIGADPKPAKRIVATPQEWAEIRREKLTGWPCRLCDKPAETLHHLVSKSLRGDDVPANVVPVCGDGTRGCHGLLEAHDPWACSLLGHRLTKRERDYVTGKKPGYLERRYGVKEAA
jgi:hypothetical protein